MLINGFYLPSVTTEAGILHILSKRNNQNGNEGESRYIGYIVPFAY